MDDRCYSLAVKRSLEQSIDELAAIKSLFLQHPEKDFTRNRMIDFKRFIHMNLQIEGSAILLLSGPDSYRICFLTAACKSSPGCF